MHKGSTGGLPVRSLKANRYSALSLSAMWKSWPKTYWTQSGNYWCKHELQEIVEEDNKVWEKWHIVACKEIPIPPMLIRLPDDDDGPNDDDDEDDDHDHPADDAPPEDEAAGKDSKKRKRPAPLPKRLPKVIVSK